MKGSKMSLPPQGDPALLPILLSLCFGIGFALFLIGFAVKCFINYIIDKWDDDKWDE
jgi:hypothetical protein